MVEVGSIFIVVEVVDWGIGMDEVVIIVEKKIMRG